MTPERFRQIEELYHMAREGTAEERAMLLAQTDPELRREVELLLAQPGSGEFLDRPAVQNAPHLLGDSTVTILAAGASLGPYLIQDKLGAGGMGEVFRAVDTRLGRSVAIKITREQFSARFEREARAISSLNHPNICTLYDVGPNYLVMELLEGETLAARLKGGPLSLATALLYSSQILAALAEAHSKSIVHRDLKPSNIMVGKSGIKVLDFGLARIGLDESVTASHMIMGTPAYMAPEQREGNPVDARTDIYAFGWVLYEMLTGARRGPRRQPIRPRRLERIVSRCLEEDPGSRWPSAARLQQELAAVNRRGRAVGVGAVAAAVLVLLAAAYFYLHHAPKLTEKDTLVLADFENSTGDAIFDQTLRQGLVVQLEESPFLSLVPEQHIQETLRMMDRPADSRLTPEVTREVCERTGGAAVLEGSIAGLGSQYVLGLRARDCRTGGVVAEEQVQARGKEEVLNALSRIAVHLRIRLGESLATIREHSTPLEQATTKSLAALKAFSAGWNTEFTVGQPAAIPHYERAIAIDPQFAMAHASLGLLYNNLGQTDLSAAHTRKAYELRDHVSDRERLFILTVYDRQVTGNLQRELDTLELWARTYRRDELPLSLLAGWATRGTGQYERGIQAAQAALRLGPDDTFAYGALSEHYLFLDRFVEAANALQQAAQHKIDNVEFVPTRFYLAFLKGDQAGMDREIARARGQHRLEDQMWHNQALVLARAGRMREARTLWDRAVALAQQAGDRENTAIYESAEAVCEAQFGNPAAAKKRALAALAFAKGRDVGYAAAFALALAGDSSGSQRLAADLEKRFPEDTPVQFEYLPTLHALFALGRHMPLDAVERLQRALPYDLALPGTAFFARFGGTYPAYIRGQAYLAAGRGREAAAEFQKVLDHRGIVLADPISALAHLQVGRAYVASGDMAMAKNAYQDFLALWKDADADITILKQARAEFAKL